MYKSLSSFLLNQPTSRLFWLALLLSVPAFVIHLGRIAFIGDEGIRSLVALEMKLSGNYLVPTMNGEYYFNKPPLYNWFILGMSNLFGQFGEWPARLTTILSLAGFVAVVYYFIQRHQDKMTAMAVSLTLLTCGRILFWDSMLGLIDICFSAVIFFNFMLLFHLGKKRKWLSFFFWSYLLFALAFLLKGLPALVFQAISILTALFLFNKLKSKLFSLAHVVGALAGMIPLSLYYFLYAQTVSLEHVLSILTDQSMQRTGTHHGLLKTIIHVFTFPVEQMYHFLPWTLLMPLFFHPKFRGWLRENEFVRFSFWMMMANLPVYWLSVQVYPRYILMFIPLFTLVGYYILTRSLEMNKRWWNMIHVELFILGLTGFVFVLGMLVYPPVRMLPHIILIWIASSATLSVIILGLFVDKARMFLWMALALLVVRISFDLVVLPLRATTFSENVTRLDVRRAANHHPDQPWLIYGESETHQVARFYTSAYTNQIIRKTTALTNPEALYLVDRKMYPDFPGVQIDSIILERGQIMALMKTVGR